MVGFIILIGLAGWKGQKGCWAFSHTETPNPSLLKKVQMLGNKGGKGMSLLVRK